MADNAPLPTAPGSTRKAATDEVTHSGDLGDVQLVRLVDVTGAEGSKTVVSNDAIVSTANSSTALLILSGIFTGTAEDVTNNATIVVSVFASHASATDGLQIQQSSDGVFWDFVDTFTIPAATGKTFSVAVVARFFRVVYTNGGTLQTAFRLSTIFSKNVKKGGSVRPQNGRSNENDFEEVLSYLMGHNGTTWDMLKARSGALNVETDPRRVLSFKGRTCSFRTPGRAGTVGQKIFSLHNATGSAVIVDVKRLKVDLVSTAVRAITVQPALIRLWKVTVLPTNGTALTKVSKDSSLYTTSSASVTVLGDASADGTGSGTTLTATLPAGTFFSQEFGSRNFTAVGQEAADKITFLDTEEDVMTLRPLEGVVVFLDYTTATFNPTTDFWTVSCDWDEYTAA